MRVRVKICGLTRAEDVAAAAGAGADALGFMFYEPSPRHVTVEDAETLCRAVPASVTRVGVFVDAAEAFILETARRCRLGLLQFHGAESPEFCGRFALPVVKAFRVQGPAILDELRRFDTAGWLLDSFVPGQRGGTGATFNWDLAAAAVALGRPVWLAGGLTAANVTEAVRRVRPYAVDVSSGVEGGPGQKDPGKLRAFVAAVRAAAAAECC
jgi:phosphoribosylanthranilate isomerase